MSTRSFRIIGALGALVGAAATLSACGGGIPGNAVATVNGTAITRASFNHWIVVANNSAAAATPGAKVPPVPDPPSFSNCVAYHQRTDPKPPKGTPAPTAAQLRTECQQQYTNLSGQVMQFLISADWLQGEAADQGIKVSNGEIQRTFNQIKGQQFPSATQEHQFLASTGMTEQDLLFRVRLNALSNKIQTKVTNTKGKVTNAQIATYYSQHKSQFGQPQRRDLRIVLTKTVAQANQAKAQLAGGQSFKAVAGRFSIDPSTKSNGGVVLGVVRGQEEQALDAAVFSAPLHKLVGPVKTPFGFYVFQVEKITPASQQSLAQASDTIRGLLSSQQQQQALNKFVANFNKKWKSRTKCRTGFVTADCSNAPKPKGATGATGATR